MHHLTPENRGEHLTGEHRGEFSGQKARYLDIWLQMKAAVLCLLDLSPEADLKTTQADVFVFSQAAIDFHPF